MEEVQIPSPALRSQAPGPWGRLGQGLRFGLCTSAPWVELQDLEPMVQKIRHLMLISSERKRKRGATPSDKFQFVSSAGGGGGGGGFQILELEAQEGATMPPRVLQRRQYMWRELPGPGPRSCSRGLPLCRKACCAAPKQCQDP